MTRRSLIAEQSKTKLVKLKFMKFEKYHALGNDYLSMTLGKTTNLRKKIDGFVTAIFG